ncbi:hypothetical protein OAL35_01790 [bacterium]|nr:hypothetical protein [bacterium]
MQSVIAMTLVVGAAAWLARAFWRTVKSAKNGDAPVDCGHCQRASESLKTTQLVSLATKNIREIPNTTQQDTTQQDTTQQDTTQPIDQGNQR